MNSFEMKRLLAKISLGDNRQVDQLVIDDWMETIGHLSYQDAYAAVVAHRRDSTDYLMPGHITSGVGHIIRERERDESRARAMRALPHAPNTFPGREAWDAMVAAAIEDNKRKDADG